MGPVKTRASTLTMTGGELTFDVLTDSGHTIPIDSEGVEGARPTELLGVALAGCTSMDVISILRKKRQAVTGYEIRVEGHQMQARPHAFVRFDVLHVVEGTGIDPEAVRRSVELSATKYCSVGSTLASCGRTAGCVGALRSCSGVVAMRASSRSTGWVQPLASSAIESVVAPSKARAKMVRPLVMSAIIVRMLNHSSPFAPQSFVTGC